jgi:PAS domain S-box-containing protein
MGARRPQPQPSLPVGQPADEVPAPRLPPVRSATAAFGDERVRALEARVAELEAQLAGRQELSARVHADELAVLMDAVPAIVWIARDPAASVIVGNKVANEILRVGAGENASMTAPEPERPHHFRVRRHGHELRGDELPVQRAAAGESVRDDELEVVFTDGTVRHIIGNAEPLRDDAGRPRGSVAAFVDVTDSRRIAEALAESEQRLRLTYDVAPVGIAEYDLTGRFVMVNEALCRMTGYTRQELLVRRFHDITHPDDIAKTEELFLVRSRVEPMPPLHKRYLRRDGTVVWVDVRGSFVRDEHGTPLYAIAAILDITANKRAEQALIEADQAKTEFLAVLSHELRNPLAPIKNSLFVLERSPNSAAAQRAQRVLRRQVDQLSRLVDDLLDLTRISRNKIRIVRQRLELGDLVRRTVEDHRCLFETAAVRLELHLPSAPVFVSGDWHRLAQVVGNLLHNAVKFTDPGGHVQVELTADDLEGLALLRVIDDGAGMSPDVLGRLFQPFVQAESTLARSRGGLGLGLTLVRGILALHGGEIGARSDGIGKGTELLLRLPLDPGGDGSVADDIVRPPPARRRILVIEDNVDAADSLREVLELEGHEVQVCYDGQKGLERARELHPDAVLCDLGLPRIDGYEVARRLRADPELRPTFLVALSGYAMAEDVARSREAGFDEHLAKPPSLDALARLLAGAGERREA